MQFAYFAVFVVLPTNANCYFCYYRSERILAGPSFSGKVVKFCRQKGHGFIQPSDGSEQLFMHISELVLQYHNTCGFIFTDNINMQNTDSVDGFANCCLNYSCVGKGEPVAKLEIDPCVSFRGE